MIFPYLNDRTELTLKYNFCERKSMSQNRKLTPDLNLHLTLICQNPTAFVRRHNAADDYKSRKFILDNSLLFSLSVPKVINV